MNTHESAKPEVSDPLGLGKLESIQPDFDGWSEIELALKDHQTGKSRWRHSAAWLAVAAGLVLVVGLSMRGMQPKLQPGLQPGQPEAINSPQLATTSDNPASLSMNDATASNNIEDGNIERPDNIERLANIGNLIGLSNKMQAQVGEMRQRTASMPAESAMYVAELEDLITQVDNELSYTPDSIDLWGQRVNLLLDLAQIYQQQWQLDYGRMASL